MIDWDRLTLFLYIVMRMSGFILLNPLLGRSNVPGIYKAGMIMMLSVVVGSIYPERIATPATILEFVVIMCLEFAVGLLIAVIMQIFFYIPEQAGEVVDTQMGMSMARAYDAGSQSSSTSTASLLRILMMLLFFAANGHHTLLRILLTSGNIVPFGSATFGDAAANYVVQMFAECTLMAVMGQVGMGILMKVIPQINVFAINIELKVIIGLVMLLMMVSPFSEFLLGVESTMLDSLEYALTTIAAG